jgi:hypothetical protein
VQILFDIGRDCYNTIRKKPNVKVPFGEKSIIQSTIIDKSLLIDSIKGQDYAGGPKAMANTSHTQENIEIYILILLFIKVRWHWFCNLKTSQIKVACCGI